MNWRSTILVAFCVAVLASSAQATVAAEYTCKVRIQPAISSTTDCVAPVAVTSFTPGDEAVLRVNMAGSGGPYQCMTVELVLVNPNGWVANIGNSPTNNGFGGDAGTRVEDSELEVVAGTPNALRVYTNDNSPGVGTPLQRILRVDDFASGITRVTFDVSSTSLRARESLLKKNACLRSSYIYRRTEDQFYHIGLNRVIFGPGARVGSGVWTADITLSSVPCLCQ